MKTWFGINTRTYTVFEVHPDKEDGRLVHESCGPYWYNKKNLHRTRESARLALLNVLVHELEMALQEVDRLQDHINRISKEGIPESWPMKLEDPRSEHTE